MMNTYSDLIDQTYYFPQKGFDLRDGYLTFHGISIKSLIEIYSTSFKAFYMPGISKQIRKSIYLFNKAIKKKRDKYYSWQPDVTEMNISFILARLIDSIAANKYADITVTPRQVLGLIPGLQLEGNYPEQLDGNIQKYVIE